MNKQALESFMDICDEMLVPVEESFGMTVKSIALNAKNAISKLIKILLEKIRSLREYFKTNVRFAINSNLYNKVVGLSNTYQHIITNYMPYIMCKKPFTSEVKKEYEETINSKILNELNSVPKIVIKAESMLPIVDSKAKEIYTTIAKITGYYEATAKGLDGILGRMEGTLSQLSKVSTAPNAGSIGGPTADRNAVNDSITLANRHVWLLQETISIMNKFISAFRKTIGTPTKQVQKGSGSNTSFA